jgi:hypothetical protein
MGQNIQDVTAGSQNKHHSKDIADLVAWKPRKMARWYIPLSDDFGAAYKARSGKREFVGIVEANLSNTDTAHLIFSLLQLETPSVLTKLQHLGWVMPVLDNGLGDDMWMMVQEPEVPEQQTPQGKHHQAFY